MIKKKNNLYKCKECGKNVTQNDLHYFDNIIKSLVEQQLCFNCEFWTEKLKWKNNSRVVRINGHYYYINDENKNNGFRGLCLCTTWIFHLYFATNLM